MSAARPARRVVLLAGVLGLGGCVRIPDSSPVRTATPRAAASVPAVNVVAQPPEPGASATAVVTGFVEACLRGGPDYATARLYLTPSAAAGWDPTAGTTVFSSDTTWRSPDSPDARSRRVVRDGRVVGHLDAAGTYTAAVEPGPSLAAVAWFVVEPVGGELRIASLPAGILVAVEDFARVYDRWLVAYLTVGLQTIVPDAVHLPVTGSAAAAATALVDRLLAAPSAWLAPVVRSALPAGTAVAPPGAVVLDNGTAEVDLAGPVARADDPDRASLSAQLVTTLRQLGDDTGTVTAVRITAGGRTLSPQGVPDPQPVDSWAGYSAEEPGPAAGLWALAETTGGARGTAGRIVVLHGDPTGDVLTETRVPGITGGAAPRALAVERVTGDLAVVSGDGTAVLVAQTESGVFGTARRVLTGSGLVSVAFDPGRSTDTGVTPSPSPRPGGRVWGLWATDSSGRVRVWDGERAGLLTVDLRGLAAVGSLDLTGAVVRRVLPARDGRRAAVVVTGARGRRGATVLLCRVRRTGGLRLEAPRLVTAAYPQVVDVAWVDGTSLALLVRDSAEVLGVVTVRQDGWGPDGPGAVPGTASALAAAPDQPLVAVSAAGGGTNGSLATRSTGSVRFTALNPQVSRDDGEPATAPPGSDPAAGGGPGAGASGGGGSGGGGAAGGGTGDGSAGASASPTAEGALSYLAAVFPG